MLAGNRKFFSTILGITAFAPFLTMCITKPEPSLEDFLAYLLVSLLSVAICLILRRIFLVLEETPSIKTKALPWVCVVVGLLTSASASHFTSTTLSDESIASLAMTLLAPLLILIPLFGLPIAVSRHAHDNPSLQKHTKNLKKIAVIFLISSIVFFSCFPISTQSELAANILGIASVTLWIISIIGYAFVLNRLQDRFFERTLAHQDHYRLGKIFLALAPITIFLARHWDMIKENSQQVSFYTPLWTDLMITLIFFGAYILLNQIPSKRKWIALLLCVISSAFLVTTWATPNNDSVILSIAYLLTCITFFVLPSHLYHHFKTNTSVKKYTGFLFLMALVFTWFSAGQFLPNTAVIGQYLVPDKVAAVCVALYGVMMYYIYERFLVKN